MDAYFSPSPNDALRQPFGGRSPREGCTILGNHWRTFCPTQPRAARLLSFIAKCFSIFWAKVRSSKLQRRFRLPNCPGRVQVESTWNVLRSTPAEAHCTTLPGQYYSTCRHDSDPKEDCRQQQPFYVDRFWGMHAVEVAERFRDCTTLTRTLSTLFLHPPES